MPPDRQAGWPVGGASALAAWPAVDLDAAPAVRRPALPDGWQALIDAMPGAVWVVEGAGLTIVAANTGTERLVGGPARRWVGRPVAALCASPEDVCFWNEPRAGLTAGLESDTLTLRGTKALPVTRKISRVELAEDTLWIVAMQDRSHQVDEHRELLLAAADLRATLESTHEGLLVTDLGGRIRNFNRRFASLWGLPHELLVRGDDDGVFEWMRRAVVDPPAYMLRLAELDDLERAEATDVFHLQGGRIIERTVRPQLACGRPIGRVASFRDVTESVDAERRVQMLAFADPLTGLPNRRLLADRTAQSLALLRRDGTGFGLLSIDLDHFAAINLRLGRRTADDMLREAATRIGACLRQVDTVARLGSDEFAVLVQHTDAAGVEMVAARIVATLARPFDVPGGQTQPVGGSVGIVLCPSDGMDFDTLLVRAADAMREVKGAGRAGFRFWRSLDLPAGRAANGPP